MITDTTLGGHTYLLCWTLHCRTTFPCMRCTDIHTYISISISHTYIHIHTCFVHRQPTVHIPLPLIACLQEEISSPCSCSWSPSLHDIHALIFNGLIGLPASPILHNSIVHYISIPRYFCRDKLNVVSIGGDWGETASLLNDRCWIADFPTG
jgi:hypothetical protein